MVALEGDCRARLAWRAPLPTRRDALSRARCPAPHVTTGRLTGCSTQSRLSPTPPLLNLSPVALASLSRSIAHHGFQRQFAS